jgi:fatty acid desaturase
VVDIAIDWVVVLGSVAAVVLLSGWLAPLAVVLIANRQRALGNILHDAGHRNLWRDRRRNDLIARLAVAPLLFASLTSYREAHFRHHLSLGDTSRDPDFLPIPACPPRHWLASFARNACAWPAWLGSFAGHLASAEVSVASKLFIVGWWTAAVAASLFIAGAGFTGVFLLLWLVARGTVFHLITTFREMCDHFGLQPGGIFTFTRDMACHGFWRQLIHPRNNGYHLTHHLLPAVPYYRLPQAHHLFEQMPVYRAQASVCHAYFTGQRAVTAAWQARGR